jgi:hypothetical protein
MAYNPYALKRAKSVPATEKGLVSEKIDVAQLRRDFAEYDQVEKITLTYISLTH